MLNYLLPKLADLQQEASQLPESPATRAAVHLALWLIIAKGLPQTRAVRTAANKQGATQTDTLRGVRAIIPPEYFHQRQREGARLRGPAGTTPARRPYAEQEQQRRQHMNEISLEQEPTP